MKVTDVNENNYFFENLRGGDVFRYRNAEYYVKLFNVLNDGEKKSNAVSLLYGTGKWFMKDDAVERVSGRTLRFSD